MSLLYLPNNPLLIQLPKHNRAILITRSKYGSSTVSERHTQTRILLFHIEHYLSCPHIQNRDTTIGKCNSDHIHHWRSLDAGDSSLLLEFEHLFETEYPSLRVHIPQFQMVIPRDNHFIDVGVRMHYLFDIELHPHRTNLISLRIHYTHHPPLPHNNSISHLDHRALPG